MSELREVSRIKAVSDTLCQAVIEREIVSYGKPHGKHLFCLEQMAYISSGVTAANGTVALRVNGQCVFGILLVFYVDYTAPGKEMAVAAVSRRHNAVKKVHAPMHALNYISGRSYAHKVPGLVFRHMFLYCLYGIVHLLMALPYRKAADCVTGQIQLSNPFHMPNSYVFEDCALIYPEEHLPRIDRIFHAVIFI